jgi:hypothetical protein
VVAARAATVHGRADLVRIVIEAERVTRFEG